MIDLDSSSAVDIVRGVAGCLDNHMKSLLSELAGSGASIATLEAKSDTSG